MRIAVVGSGGQLAAGVIHECAGAHDEQSIRNYDRCIQSADRQPSSTYLARLKSTYCAPYQEIVRTALANLGTPTAAAQ